MRVLADTSASPINDSAGGVEQPRMPPGEAQHMDLPPTSTPLLSYGLYPLVVGGATVAAGLAVRGGASRSAAAPAIIVTAIAVCMFVEWRHPLEARWSMTARSLGRRDLPYLMFGLALERACEVAVIAIATRTVSSGGFGPISRLPLGVQVVVAITSFDLLWYWYHRLAHQRSRMWRVHGAHHTPGQMYVLMHGVFHPFDELVVRFVLALVVFRFVGFAPDATFIALVIIGTVGIISHLNADVRLWAFNHVLIGPETHRYHHSATHLGNYGTVTSIWDQVFRTFVFEPLPPARLGLTDPNDYPNPEHFLQVLAWPLRRNTTSPPDATVNLVSVDSAVS
jgi:sterol desaturase/sphingolipid hydroxylase (fatty acid hydroxylase superfamily)